MFLESIGKLCFSKKGLGLFYLLLLLPFLIAGTFLFFSHASQKLLEDEFHEAARKGQSAFERKIRKEKFLSRYSHADPFFLEKQIEPLPLLENERDACFSLIEHPALAKKEPIAERLKFLEQTNRIKFIEENIRTSKSMKETDVNMRSRVQLNAMDLQKILSNIEDVPIENEPLPNGPQLVVRNLKLKKTGELFELEMELIKREWIE